MPILIHRRIVDSGFCMRDNIYKKIEKQDLKKKKTLYN